jgi:hypothetical protein
MLGSLANGPMSAWPSRPPFGAHPAGAPPLTGEPRVRGRRGQYHPCRGGVGWYPRGYIMSGFITMVRFPRLRFPSRGAVAGIPTKPNLSHSPSVYPTKANPPHPPASGRRSRLAPVERSVWPVRLPFTPWGGLLMKNQPRHRRRRQLCRHALWPPAGSAGLSADRRGDGFGAHGLAGFTDPRGEHRCIAGGQSGVDPTVDGCWRGGSCSIWHWRVFWRSLSALAEAGGPGPSPPPDRRRSGCIVRVPPTP